MLYQLGRELQSADFTVASESNAIVARLRRDLGETTSTCILCMLRAHSAHEEQDFFAPVRRLDPEVIDFMMREHAEVARRIAGVVRTCDELIGLAEPARRIEVGDRLNLETNDLFAFYLAHLNNEEATLVPVMWERFTDDELRAMRAKFYDALPLPRFEEWLRWTLPALNLNELVVLYAGLQSPPRSARLGEWVRLAREHLDDVRWETLRDRVHLPVA